MTTQCSDCGKVYNDARRWTICPHPSLDEAPPRKESSMSDQASVVNAPRHPSVAGVLQFFIYAHLPPHLQAVSKQFTDLATSIADGPQNAETTVALRKLLEAKDCAVRAILFK